MQNSKEGGLYPQIKKYAKKPVVIEAIQWTGENAISIMEFVGKGKLQVSSPPRHYEFDHDVTNEMVTIKIPTLEGDMICQRNDYVIKGIKGECYPCKPDIFELTYELVR